MQPTAYFHTDSHLHAVDQLEDIARNFDPEAPDDLRTRIIEVLGDLGVWPIIAFSGTDEGEVIVVA